MTLTVRMAPGTSTWDAFRDAWRLARKLDVSVEFPFNDSRCVAFARGEGIELRGHVVVADWRESPKGSEMRERGRTEWESEGQWLSRKTAELAAKERA